MASKVAIMPPGYTVTSKVYIYTDVRNAIKLEENQTTNQLHIAYSMAWSKNLKNPYILYVKIRSLSNILIFKSMSCYDIITDVRFNLIIMCFDTNIVLILYRQLRLCIFADKFTEIRTLQVLA